MEFLAEYGLFLLKVMTIVIAVVIVMAAGAAAGAPHAATTSSSTSSIDSMARIRFIVFLLDVK